jgi:hypothetical protein
LIAAVRALRWLRLCVASLLLVCHCQSGWTQELAEPKRLAEGCALGAYIQLVDENGAWPEAAWRSLFADYQKLGVKKLIIQWSVYEHKAFYASKHFASFETKPLETILTLADAADLRVLVGLSHDPHYWINIQDQDKRAYLLDRLRKNTKVAAELATLVSQHKSFAGWYISEEIDDINWQTPVARDALASYLQQTSAFLRVVSPPRTAIGISGFANAKTPPKELEAFWSDLLGRVRALDRIYFQDGIGVGKLDLKNLDRYYQAIKNATTKAGRDFIPVVEVFKQTAGEPLTPGVFAAAPTELPKLLQQLKIARQYAAQPVVFGIAEYMTPGRGDAARALYNAYLDARQDCGQEP